VHPWSMAWLPDDSILVTERPGRVRHLNSDGSVRTKSIPGAPAVAVVGQGGLLDIALHPDFHVNRLVYFTLSTGTRSSNRTTLAYAKFDGKQFLNLKELFHVSHTKSGGQHFGSRLLWLPNKTLLMSIGDGGNPPMRIGNVLSREMAQDGQSHLGKVLHMNAEGQPVTEEVFSEDTAILSEIYTMGHRNIQGLAYDPVRKIVWATEHGARGGDELNSIKGGENYGWPEATYSKDYSTFQPVSKYTSLPGMTDPKLVWTPSIAPSGLMVYTGNKFPQWQGNLFAGALRGQSIRRIILDANNDVANEEIIRIGRRVRDVRQGPDGYIYLLTDEPSGKLIRLEP